MERLTTNARKIFARESFTLNSMTKNELHQHYNEIFDQLQRYEVAEESGLLARLPCKVGNTVYEVQELRRRIQPYTIISICISNCSILFGWELKDGEGIYSNVNGFCDYAIGKTVFLTQEEAEQALKERDSK